MRVVPTLPLLLLAALARPEPQPYPTPASRPDPDFSASAHRYRIPWQRKVNFDKLASLHVRASLDGGRPASFQVDTGSVGVIVSRDEVPDIDPNAPKGSITYSSSGIELRGVWTTTTITFPDSTDGRGHVATAVVPVLAVDEQVNHAGAVNGRANAATHPTSRPHPHMFGIGFGRGAEPHPERNPWINLAEMQAGTMRRGYTITREGITLGLTAKDVGPGYLYQPLEERKLPDDTTATHPGLKDWKTAPGRIAVAGKDELTAAVLLDTGLTNMMIGKPGLAQRADVTDEAEITVTLMNGRLRYTFKANDAEDPVTPRKVTWTTSRNDTPTLNTGLRALAIYDYLYDADGGFLGLRPTRNHR